MTALFNFIAAILGFLGKLFGRTDGVDAKRLRQLEDAAAADAKARLEKIDAATVGADRATADRMLREAGSKHTDTN